MEPSERRMRIAERVAREGRQSVEALAAAFNVSSETIRRDLGRLAQDGLVRKIHGAALGAPVRAEKSVTDRMAEDTLAKHAIATRVAELVSAGETLFMDTGSTTLLAARALQNTADLTVITNSAAIADIVGRAPRGRAFLLGGAYRRDSALTVGPLVIEQIERFRADRALLTITALDATGAMDADFDEAQVARAMLRSASETVVLAAGSKFRRRAAFEVCRLHEIDVLVCDREPPPDLGEALSGGRVMVQLADAGGIASLHGAN